MRAADDEFEPCFLARLIGLLVETESRARSRTQTVGARSVAEPNSLEIEKGVLRRARFVALFGNSHENFRYGGVVNLSVGADVG